MKKLFLLLLIIIVPIFSCTGKEKMGFGQRDKMNKQMAYKIVELINAKDIEGLYNLFSEEVKESDLTLKKDIGKLFPYLNGKIVSCEEYGIAMKGGIEKEKNSTRYESEFKIKIKDTVYFMYYDYTVRNDFSPKKEGLRFIKIFKESEQEKYFCYWDLIKSGVFLPDES